MPTVAIAGASGFIGRWFIEKYHKRYNIIAFTRKDIVDSPLRPNVDWRKVDMYSLSSTAEALRGADYALYLVHSMSPSTRLNQGTFEDTDLLLADNFCRAAEKCKVKQIVYMGGILPKDSSQLSRHLRSRLETEKTLGARTTPLTALRAGIIIGPGGSSFKIVQKLVNRLPVMICPQWTTSESQPIDIDDALSIIDQSFGNEQVFNKAIEIGGEEVITYMALLKKTASVIGKKRKIFSVPFFTLGFSKLWVSLFSNSSTTLVSPLIESLKHDMKLPKQQPHYFEVKYTSLSTSLLKALEQEVPNIPERIIHTSVKNTVRSYQRLPNPGNKSVEWVANAYPKWLTRTFKLFLRASDEGDFLVFRLLGIKLLCLKFIPESSDAERQIFYIVGGKLAKRLDFGWLEFRSVLENKFIISAIHEFVPRLPWLLYKYSQAVVHLWVMTAFGNFLNKQQANLKYS